MLIVSRSRFISRRRRWHNAVSEEATEAHSPYCLDGEFSEVELLLYRVLEVISRTLHRSPSGREERF